MNQVANRSFSFGRLAHMLKRMIRTFNGAPNITKATFLNTVYHETQSKRATDRYDNRVLQPQSRSCDWRLEMEGPLELKLSDESWFDLSPCSELPLLRPLFFVFFIRGIRTIDTSSPISDGFIISPPSPPRRNVSRRLPMMHIT